MEIYEKQDICLKCMHPLKGEKRCPKCGFDIDTYKPKEHHLKPRTILHGQYIIGTVLGEGGFGITYVGWDLMLHMMVAIKEYFPVGIVMRDSVQNTVSVFSGADEEFFRHDRGKFMNEAQKLAKFDGNPGVVSVKNYFMENGTAYIVMEYIQGITLNTFIQQNGGKLSMQQTLTLLDMPMRTLAQLHKDKTFHRDISPENLMVTNDNAVKLIDFGSAMDHNVDMKTRTLKVRPGYSPIELYTTDGKEDTYTDIYALCATIYKAITGVVPPMVTERIMEDKLIPPSKLGAKGITPKQEKALMTGLAVNSANRYQSMEELRKDLMGNEAQKSGAEWKNKMPLITLLIVVLVLGGLLGYNALKLKAEPALVVTTEPTAAPTREPALAFASPEFEQSLREAIGRTHGEEIYAKDLAFVTSLTISGDRLNLNENSEECPEQLALPLEDLQLFGNLTSLKINVASSAYPNVLSDIAKLPKLETLKIIWHNEGSTISMAQLSEAPALKNLQVDNGWSNVIGIDFGSGIPTLETLEICSEFIQNVNFGGNMTALRVLTVSGGNKVMSDCSFISSLPALEVFNMRDAHIERIGFGESTIPVQYLNINNYDLKEIQLPEDMPNLVGLYLRETHLTDISFINNLSTLKYLVIGANVEEMDFTGILPELKLLNIHDYQLISLELGESRELLENLSVELGWSPLHHLNYLEDAPNLVSFGLNHCYHIENGNVSYSFDAVPDLDLSPLAPLTNLQTLLLYHNGVNNLSPLAGLHNLTHLEITSNTLEDASVISTLPVIDGSLKLECPSVNWQTLYGDRIDEFAVQFASPEFENMLRKQWGLSEEDTYYFLPNELSMVRDLTIADGVFDAKAIIEGDLEPTDMLLEDLKYFTGLANLKIVSNCADTDFINSIAQLRILQNLDITWINPNEEPCDLDLSALSQIPWLNEVRIRADGVRSINMGEGSPDMFRLTVGGNMLEEVRIGSDQELRLEYLYIFEGKVEDYSFIANVLPELRTLILNPESGENFVMRDVKNHPNLTVVDINDDGVNDLPQ